MKKTILALTMGLSLSVTINAAIAPISSATLTAPANKQVGMVDFTVNSEVYSLITIGTARNLNLGGSGPILWYEGPTDTSGQPASNRDSLNDTFITTGLRGDAFDGSSNLLVDFGTTLNVGDTRLIFITELNGNDSVVINPITGNTGGSNPAPGSGSVGTVDSSWSLTLNSTSHWGEVIPSGDYIYNGYNNPIGGTTFQISDFTGGAGTLTDVTGILIQTVNALDPTQVGVAAIPEPGTLALVGLALGSLVFIRRR